MDRPPPAPGPASSRDCPTLEGLCRSLGLRTAGAGRGDGEEACGAARDGGRAVRGVWPAGGDPGAPRTGGDLRDLIVLPAWETPRGDAAVERFVRRAAEQGAAALARPETCEKDADTPDSDGLEAERRSAARELDRAAARVGIPVLLLPPGSRGQALAQAIADERVRLARERARIPAEVLTRLRPRAGRQDGVRRLVDWLAGAVGGPVTVVGADGGPLAAAAGAWEAVRPVAPTIARVADGGLASAVVDAGEWEVRLVALGAVAPRPVLAVARPRRDGVTVCPSSASEATAYAADALPLLLRLEEADAVERHTRRALAAAGVGVLQMLLGGQLLLAQRTAAAVRPGLLDAEDARVLIVSGRPAGRDAVVEECSLATDGRALVVRCPVYSTDVILVAPAYEEAGIEAWATVEGRLREVVAAGEDRCMGGSALMPLGSAAGAYREASHALAVARQLPERVVLHSPETQLADVLDAGAHAWAAQWLAPLLELPYAGRDQLLDTLRLVLEFGVSGASRISGRHRNTVAAARRRAAELLDADLDDVTVRARLDLALGLLLRVPGGRVPDGPVSAAQVLNGAAARWWAQRRLAVLKDDGRDLLATVVAWIGCNAGVLPAAARLGVYPGTVRDRLRTAGGLLHRDLMTASGPHDLVLALLAAGELPGPAD